MPGPGNLVSAVWCNRVIFSVIAVAVAISDQVTKALIENNLAIGESILDIGFFRITHIKNTGASFGIFQGHNILFAVINFIGLAVILFLVFFNKRRFPLLNLKPAVISLGLIAGGIIGNLTDRLISGQVTDFIDFSFWPAFNVADSAIVIGSIILCLAIIFQYRDTSPSSDGEKT